MSYKKKYVKVAAVFSPEGKVTPQIIIWDDGRQFPIEKITAMRKEHSTKVGGFWLRYTCRIKGKEKYLFRDHDKWFIEVEE